MSDDTSDIVKRVTKGWAEGSPDVLLGIACKEIEELRQQRDEATAWRPIESAPMDGTVMLLYGEGRVTCGSWIAEQDIMVGEHHHTTGEWLGAHPSGETTPAYWESHDGGFTEEHPPTHWMPLPHPPRGKEGGG